jgi:Protein of unknown function (DUF3048) N-terminal domain/Protein of unknown function (DUF3048) C-terminal domain
LARGHLRSIAPLVALALLVAACGGKSAATRQSEPVAHVEPSTADPTTTTATVPPPPAAPLTGVVGDPATVARPVLAVKIDNVKDAHPQSGINQADVVFEEMVENSSTRLMALFQSTDAAPIGPVRSARPTDLLLFTPLNRPLFAWSGANEWVRPMIQDANIVDVGNTPAVDQYYRERTRKAPHNLFIQGYESMLASHQADAGAPPALFAYRAPNEPLAAGAHPIAGIHIEWGRLGGNAPVDYEWDPNLGGWLRWQAGAPHVDTNDVQVGPPNVVIMFVDYVDDGGLPVAQLSGQGTAWVLTAGQLIEGTWNKPAPEAPAQLLDAAGAPIKLTPGRTWVSLPAPGMATVTG